MFIAQHKKRVLEHYIGINLHDTHHLVNLEPMQFWSIINRVNKYVVHYSDGLFKAKNGDHFPGGVRDQLVTLGSLSNRTEVK